MSIAIFYSIDEELKFIDIYLKNKNVVVLSNSRRATTGKLFGKKVILSKIGVSKKYMEENIRVIEEKFHISSYWLIGFSGAVSKSLKLGNFIFPGVIKNEGAEDIKIEHGNSEHVLFTGDKVFYKHDKHLLKEKFQDVCAVDMEAYYFAKRHQKLGKKFYIVKTISDTSDFVMPDISIMIKYFRIPIWRMVFSNFKMAFLLFKIKGCFFIASFFLARHVREVMVRYEN